MYSVNIIYGGYYGIELSNSSDDGRVMGGRYDDEW